MGDKGIWEKRENHHWAMRFKDWNRTSGVFIVPSYSFWFANSHRHPLWEAWGQEKGKYVQNLIPKSPYWPHFAQSFNLPKPDSHPHAKGIYKRMENCPENE